MIEFQNEFTQPGGKMHDAVKQVMRDTDMLRKVDLYFKIRRIDVEMHSKYVEITSKYVKFTVCSDTHHCRQM